MLDKYGSVERLFEWSSPEEGNSSEEDELFLESSTSMEASTGATGNTSVFKKPSVPSIRLSSKFTKTLSSVSSSNQQKAIKAPDSYVLPGRGRPKELLRLSRFRRDVQKRVAQEWGFDYPYVPEQIMDIVEASREQWEGDLVWDYLHVLKPQRTPDSEVWVRFQDIYKEWKLGRAIYKDRVLVLKAGQHTCSYSISVKEQGILAKDYPILAFICEQDSGVKTRHKICLKL